MMEDKFVEWCKTNREYTDIYIKMLVNNIKILEKVFQVDIRYISNEEVRERYWSYSRKYRCRLVTSCNKYREFIDETGV